MINDLETLPNPSCEHSHVTVDTILSKLVYFHNNKKKIYTRKGDKVKRKVYCK